MVKELIPQLYMMNARNRMSLVCQDDNCFKVTLFFNGIEDGTLAQDYRDLTLKRWTSWENGAVSYIILNRFFDPVLSNKMTSWCMYLQMLYAKCILILEYTSCVRDIVYMVLLMTFCLHDNVTVYVVNRNLFCPALAAAANSNSR